MTPTPMCKIYAFAWIPYPKGFCFIHRWQSRDHWSEQRSVISISVVASVSCFVLVPTSSMEMVGVLPALRDPGPWARDDARQRAAFPR